MTTKTITGLLVRLKCKFTLFDGQWHRALEGK